MTLVDTQRDEWLSWRRDGVGASEVAAIVGVSPFSTPYQVWLSKTAGVEFDETEPMLWGNLLETVILDEFERRTGMHVAGRQLRAVHPVHGHHRATLDAYAGDHRDVALLDALSAVEVKNTSDYSWTEVPLHYYLQGQWQLHVTGLDLVVFAVLHAGTRLELYEIERDADDIGVLVDAVDRFWFDHVLAGVEPEVVGRDLSAARAAHATATAGSRLDADETIVDLVAQLRAAQATADDAVEYVDQLKARLIGRIGAHELIIDPATGDPLVTYRASRTFDLDAAVDAHYAAADAATVTVRQLDVDAFKKALGRKTVDTFMRPGGSRRLLFPTRKDT